MIRIENILFPSDFSRCASQALDDALVLAQKYRAALHLLHAIVLHSFDPEKLEQGFVEMDEEIASQLQQEAARRLDTAAEALAMDGLQIKKTAKRGISAPSVILEYAEDNDVDLIVMGTHGRRGAGYLLLGSVAEQIVRHARCPVLTIRERAQPRNVKQTEEILVPVDFSDHSRQALVYAKHLAQMLDARLHLLHVIDQTVHPAFYAAGKTLMQLDPDLEDRCRTEMQKMLAEAAGPDLDVAMTIVEGRATREIVRFAEESGSDMIVIATHGLTGLKHFLLGSVAEKVVRRGPCPVLAVRSFGKSLVAESPR